MEYRHSAGQLSYRLRYPDSLLASAMLDWLKLYVMESLGAFVPNDRFARIWLSLAFV